MVADFATAMGNPGATFSDGYLAKLRRSWIVLDPAKTGYLRWDQLPQLTTALARAPEPIVESWQLESDEASAWASAGRADRSATRR